MTHTPCTYYMHYVSALLWSTLTFIWCLLPIVVMVWNHWAATCLDASLPPPPPPSTIRCVTPHEQFLHPPALYKGKLVYDIWCLWLRKIFNITKGVISNQIVNWNIGSHIADRGIVMHRKKTSAESTPMQYPYIAFVGKWQFFSIWTLEKNISDFWH